MMGLPFHCMVFLIKDHESWKSVQYFDAVIIRVDMRSTECPEQKSVFSESTLAPLLSKD